MRYRLVGDALHILGAQRYLEYGPPADDDLSEPVCLSHFAPHRATSYIVSCTRGDLLTLFKNLCLHKICPIRTECVRYGAAQNFLCAVLRPFRAFNSTICHFTEFMAINATRAHVRYAWA